MNKKIKMGLVVCNMIMMFSIIVIVVKSKKDDYSLFNGKTVRIIDAKKIVDVITGTSEEYRDSRVKSLTSEELLEQTIKEEKIEEKYVPKKLKQYPNEIVPEERAVRLYPSEEREIGVALNIEGAAVVNVSSTSKDVTIVNNATMNIKGSFCMNVDPKFKIKVSENAKVNQKVKILLKSDGLDTETITVSIDSKPKDMEGISLYYDMVPGMTFSSSFFTSFITKDERKFVEHKYKIKNYSNDVLIEKDGEIRAWNVGDAVISIVYKSKTYKVYVRVRKEEIYDDVNKEETSIHFVNPITEDLKVGDEYSLMAVTLPYMYSRENENYYDRMIIYETSDPSVCTVAYGDVRAEGVGKCTITAYNKSRTLSTSIDVTVVPKKEVKYTRSETMNITPDMARQYGLSNTNGISTTNGFKKIVKDAQSQGKKKVYFTEPLELVMEPYGKDIKMVYLASDTMYDFNGTKIQLVQPQNHEVEWGYHMFVMDGIKNTTVKNLNMTGTKPTGGSSIAIPNAVDCTVEGCNLGYNYYNVDIYSDNFEYDHMKQIKANVFQFGNVRSDGTLSDSKCRVRSDFIDVTHIDADEDFMVGDFSEFSPYDNAPSVLYDIAYYDKDKRFIKKESCHAQYFPYYRPKNATFCRIIFHTDELPTDRTEGYYTGYCVKFGHIKRGYKCTIKNNVLHNATHVNLGLFGEQSCVFDGNTFHQDEYEGTDIDWEDYFHAKTCDITRNNFFSTPYNGISVVSGTGYVIRNNAFFKSSFVKVHGGIRHFRFFGNLLGNIPVGMENCYDSIVSNNVIGCDLYFRAAYFLMTEAGEDKNGIMPRLRIENNTRMKYGL